MHPKFAEFVDQLMPAYERLVTMEPIRAQQFPKPMPKSGIYLFSEGDDHMYVGRSNKIRQRYGQHCNPGSQQNQAVFAFKLAREATGHLKPAYQTGGGTRTELVAMDAFKDAFIAAKARIRNMDYRFVEESNQVRQALLEIYCSVMLGTRYNDFDTH